MAILNWNAFKYQYDGKETKAFEALAYELFCLDQGKDGGIFRYKNQTGIETEPIPIGEELIGFQAKYYETKISDNKKDIMDSLQKAKSKNPNINKVYLYLNQEFSESRDKNVKDPGYKIEIENFAAKLDLTIVWQVPSHFEIILSQPICKEIREYYFPEFSVGSKENKSIPKALTLKIPSLSSSKIIGRRTDLNKIRAMMVENKEVVLVNGFGGIGKTTIAQVYAHEHWVDYAHIAWITCTSDDFKFDLVNAMGLRDSLEVPKEILEVDEIFQKILLELKRIQNRPNLLIIDNANDNLQRYLSSLPSSHDWHILITSRDEIEGVSIHHLGFLSAEDAFDLFKHHYKLKILSNQNITDLVKKVEFHTLTIEILAKTAQLQRFNFNVLEEALQKDIISDVKTARSGQKEIKKITTYLCSIFKLNALSKNEIWLLKNLLFLPSNFHTYDLLIEVIDPVASNKEKIFAKTLNSLVQKSWVQYNAETDSYKMHIVVAEVLKKKEKLCFKDISSLIIKLTNLLFEDEDIYIPNNTNKWTLIGQSIPVELIKELSSANEIQLGDFLTNLGLRLKDLSVFKESKLNLTKALDIYKNYFGEYHTSTANCYSNLGSVLIDLEEFELAKSFLFKALRINTVNFGEENRSTARSLSNLSALFVELGDYKEAKEMMIKVLKIHKKTFGLNHPATARSYSNLGVIYKELGKFKIAEKLMIKAMVIECNCFGPNHSVTSIRYFNLACIYQDLGEIENAQTFFLKTIESNKKIYGLENPKTADSIMGLATLYLSIHEYEMAKMLLLKSLEIYIDKLGVNHGKTTMCFSNLANAYQNLGELDFAKELFIKALKNIIYIYGNDHPNTAIASNNLGLLHIKKEDYIEADVLLNSAVSIDEKNFGLFHPSTIRSYNNLCSLYHKLGELKKAIDILRKVRDINEKVFGLEHLNTAESYLNLSLVLKDSNDIPEAIIFSKKALDICRKTFPENHPNIKTVEDTYNHLKSLI